MPKWQAPARPASPMKACAASAGSTPISCSTTSTNSSGDRKSSGSSRSTAAGSLSLQGARGCREYALVRGVASNNCGPAGKHAHAEAEAHTCV